MRHLWRGCGRFAADTPALRCGCCARQLNVDILVTGHTHDNKVMKYEGKYYINPGSITGAYSGVTP